MGTRLVLPTRLNLDAWNTYLQGYDDTLLAYINYGFPMGYIGPVSDTVSVPNHPSALQFGEHVSEFVDKERSLGGLIGPFDTPPFIGWCHVSPLMTRPKSDKDKRRVITDLTYPRQSSINAYIRKNTVMGLTNTHSLPTVDTVVDRILSLGPGAHMFTIDVSRAYKNFKSCPLDWPLLAVKWDGQYLIDVTMPFGARASSGHMQRVADAIVHILQKKGVVAHMYLDDLVVVAPTLEAANMQYDIARSLLAELGLPEAYEKSQPPSTTIKWLGITIDSTRGTLSMPPEKLAETLDLVKSVSARRSISRKQLQSVIGKLLHIAKCIRPARLFIARLLDELRGPPRFYININSSMKSDLTWFADFASTWNGVAIFPKPAPMREIVVDACLDGIGGASHRSAYARHLSDVSDQLSNISEIEAMNIAIALQTFVAENDRGKCIKVLCDNMAAVQVLQSGRGRNRVILEAARAAWMVQALFQVTVVYEHIPGRLNFLADALSRAHQSESHNAAALELVESLHLNWVEPCTYSLPIFKSILSRSGLRNTGDRGRAQTGDSKGPGHQCKQGISGSSIPEVLPHPQMAPTEPHVSADLHVSGAPKRAPTLSPDGKESSGPLKNIPAAGPSTTHSISLQGDEGSRSDDAEERLQEERTSPAIGSDYSGSSRRHPPYKGGGGGQSGHTNNVLRSVQAGGSGPTDHFRVRPPPAPDPWRCENSQRQDRDRDKGCKEPSTLRSAETGNNLCGRRPIVMPGSSTQACDAGVTHDEGDPTHVRLSGITAPYPSILCEGPVEGSSISHWSPTRCVYTTYPQESRCILGIQLGYTGETGTALWPMGQ